MQISELGPYSLHEVLGKGGMGTVYRGVAKATGQEVAIKVLAPFYAADDGFRERFTAEIRSLEQLRHPHIVTLYGYGEENGLLYYAMELVRGESLQDELARGQRFSWREVCRLGIDICGALKQAHDHGIIHRDIKPANLLLDENGRAKLSDFGIAKLFGDTNITVGGVLGTVDYMAPEQAAGEPPTPRCDLYSMGAVLYATLAGHAPFRGKTVAEVLQKLRYDDPVPIGRINQETPEELERLIHQLLQKNPANRIPTALALSKRLSAIHHALIRDPKLATPGAKRQGRAADIEFAPTHDNGEDEFSQMATVAAGEEIVARQAVDTAATPPAKSVGPDEADNASRMNKIRQARRYVDVEAERAASKAETPRWQSALGWLALVAAICFVAFTVYRSLQPPSPEVLFGRVQLAMELADERSLLEAEPSIVSFVQLYPLDPRAPQVQQLKNDIDQLRAHKRFLANLKRKSRTVGTESLVQQQLIRLMELESTDPEGALQGYQTVRDMLAVEPIDSDELPQEERSATTLLTEDDELARSFAEQRCEMLQAQLEEQRDWQRAELKQRLEMAKASIETDRATAVRSLLAITKLYGRDDWASDLVADAKSVLMGNLPKEQGLGPGEFDPAPQTAGDAKPF